MSGSNAYSALLSPLSEVARGSRHEQGYFLGLKPGRAIVRKNNDKGEMQVCELEFDALILCNGVHYPAPIRASPAASSYSERVKELETQRRIVEASKDIVIVGGGLVGVELAAEYAVRLKHKPRITLLTRGDLLNTLPPRAGELAKQWLLSNNVSVVFGDEVQSHSIETKTLATKRGLKMPVDLLMDCTGSGPRVVAVESSLSADSETERTRSNSIEEGILWPYSDAGLVEVDDALRSSKFSHLNVFAAGDVVEHAGNGVGFAATTERGGLFGTKSKRPTIRNAHLAESQAELVAANVRRFLVVSAQTSSTAVQYLSYPRDVFGEPLNPLLSCVSLGPRHAIVVFNNIVVGGAILGMLAASIKFIIERSKVAEIRQRPWGRAFWAFGHIVVNALHCVMCRFHYFMKFLTGSSGGVRKTIGASG